MKKLKVVLLVLFAAVLATALGACKKKVTQEITSIASNQNVLELTDSDTAETFATALDSYKLSVVYKGTTKSAEIKGSDCRVVFGENIQYDANGKCVIGSYNIVLQPSADNPNGLYARIQVNVEHSWGSAENGVETCSVCHATRSQTTLETPETLLFNEFHRDDKELSGGTIIKEFGSVNVEGSGPVKVSSFTVGRLTKGASITVTGRAKSNSNAKAYYFPIIGIADTTLGTYNDAGLYQGTSIIVRNEGWVLQNGIGDQRMLAARAGGTSENVNYGSMPNDTGDGVRNRPSDYNSWKDNEAYKDYADITATTPFAASDYKDWYVYSEGTIRQTQHYYDTTEGYTGLAIEMTWTYRYDGIIELTIANPELRSSLVARVRVPDNAQGYYDTIIHGEYMDYTITGASYITPRTLTSITATANEESKYLANTMLDYSDISVKAKYQQTGDTEENATGFDVYGFVPNEKGADKVGETAGTFYDLSVYSLQTNMTHFKVVLTVGPFSQETVLEADEFVTILPNSVNEVYSYPVSKGSDKFDGSEVTDFALSVGTGDVVNLAITGYAGTLNGLLPESNATKYIAMRLYANELGSGFNATGITGDAAYVSVPEGGAYADIVLAIGESKTYTIGGLQEKDIVIDITNVQALKADSSVSTSSLFVNDAGEIVITYDFAKGTITRNTVLAVSGGFGTANFYLDQRNSGASLTVKSVTDGTNEVEADFDYANAEHIVVTLTKNATALSPNTFFGSYTIRLREGTETLAQDIVRLNKTYSNAEGVAGEVLNASGSIYAEVNGNKLYVASVATDVTNIAANNVGVRNLSLNFNEGKEITILNLAGSYVSYMNEFVLSDGELAESGVVKAYLYVDGTIDNAKDVDYVAVVLYEIDLAKVGDGEVKTFDLVGADSSKYYTIENDALVVVEYDASKYSDAIISEGGSGNCVEGALAARAITDNDGNIVFYAGARTIGGEHVDDDHNGICDLCGATITENNSFKNVGWFTSSWQDSVYITDGMFYEFIGVYGEVGTSQGMTVLLDGYKGSSWYEGYRVEGTGYGHHVLNNGSGGWGTISDPYADVEGFTSGKANFTSTLITEEHPYNTLTGTLDPEGNAIDAESLAEAMTDGTFRYTVSNIDGIITIRVRLYKKGAALNSTPYYDYSFMVEIEEGMNYKPVFTYFDNLSDPVENGTVQIIKGKLTGNSMLTGGAAATVEGYTSEGVTLGAPALDGSEVKIAVSGMADKTTTLGDNDYYVAFALAFSGDLAKTTTAKLVDANGNEIEKAIVKLNGSKSLSVLIPLNSEALLATCKILLTNLEASINQCDIVLDLSGVICSDYSAEITNNLTVDGGSLTYKIVGTVTDEMQLAVGENAVALSSVAQGTEYVTENGKLTVASVTKTSEDYTVVFNLTELDLTKPLVNYVIDLLDASDSVLATRTVNAAALPTSNAVFEGVYAIANGNQLTLVVTTGISDNATKELKLNANYGAIDSNLRLWNVAFKVSGTAASFVEWNKVTANATAVYSNLGADKVVVLHLDLSKLSLGTTYGFEAYVGVATEPALYSVSGTTVTKLNASEAQATEIAAATCEQGAITAKQITVGSGKFYYDITVGETADHVWSATANADGFLECEHCGAVKIAGAVAKGQEVAASYLAGVSENGLTVSFALTSQSADWGAFILTTVYGNLHVGLPNLEVNVHQALPEAVTDATLKANYANVTSTNDGNFFPGVNGGVNTFNGYAWNSYFGGGYATIVVDATHGVSYYLDGELAIYYPLDQIASGAKTTLGQLVEVFLALAEQGGLTLYNGSTLVSGVKDMIIQPYAVDEATAANLYAFYQEELSKHVHSYDPETDRCPDDGALNPNHVHDYSNNGVCICGARCYHEHITDGVCDDCGATLTVTQVNKSESISLGWNSAALGDIVTLAEGHEVIARGTQTADTPSSWNSLIAESATIGVTMRTDNYGWTYAPGQDMLATAGTFNGTYVLKNTEDVSVGGDPWATVNELKNACDWVAVFKWEGNVVTVSMVLTATSGEFEGYTYAATYTFTLKEDHGLTEILFHLGSDVGDPSVGTVSLTCSYVTDEVLSVAEGN